MVRTMLTESNLLYFNTGLLFTRGCCEVTVIVIIVSIISAQYQYSCKIKNICKMHYTWTSNFQSQKKFRSYA